MDKRLKRETDPDNEERIDMNDSSSQTDVKSQELTSLVFSSSKRISQQEVKIGLEINIPGSSQDDGMDVEINIPVSLQDNSYESIEGFPRDENTEEETSPNLHAWFGNGVGARVLPGAFSMPGTDDESEAIHQERIRSEQTTSPGGVIAEAYMVGNLDVTHVAIASPLHSTSEESDKHVSHHLKLACSLFTVSIVLTIILGMLFWGKSSGSSASTCEDFHGKIESSFDSVNWEQMGQTIQGIHEHEYIGSSVSICANAQRLAIGSYAHFNQYAKIYDYVNGTWEISFDISDYLPLSQQGRDDGSTITEVSFSDDCKRVAIGIPSYDAIDNLNRHPNGMLDRGIFIVFEFIEESKSWRKLGDINLDLYPYFANVGHAITISGDGNRVAFGKTHRVDNQLENGISIFELRDTSTDHPNWEFIFFQPVHHDFSISLDYLGTILAVGLPMENSNRGQLNVYNISSSEKIQSMTGLKGDMLGSTVVFSKEGQRLAVGTKVSTNKRNRDYVKVYDYHPKLKVWVQIGQNLCGGNIDFSLSQTGDHIAIGTRQLENQGTMLSVYKLDESLWKQVGRDIRVDSLDIDTSLSISLSGDGKHIAYGASSITKLEDRNKGYVEIYESRF